MRRELHNLGTLSRIPGPLIQQNPEGESYNTPTSPLNPDVTAEFWRNTTFLARCKSFGLAPIVLTCPSRKYFEWFLFGGFCSGTGNISRKVRWVDMAVPTSCSLSPWIRVDNFLVYNHCSLDYHTVNWTCRKYKFKYKLCFWYLFIVIYCDWFVFIPNQFFFDLYQLYKNLYQNTFVVALTFARTYC